MRECAARRLHARQNRYRVGPVADEIAKAAQLHDQGRITAAEYESIKRHALSY
jgi:hypothetical protein